MQTEKKHWEKERMYNCIERKTAPEELSKNGKRKKKEKFFFDSNNCHLCVHIYDLTGT